jgi:hypothetical protein
MQPGHLVKNHPAKVIGTAPSGSKSRTCQILSNVVKFCKYIKTLKFFA